jgi:hypothetical protein
MTAPHDPQPTNTGRPCELAAKWSARTYEIGGLEAAIEPLMSEPAADGSEACHARAVVVPKLRQVDCVLDGRTDFSRAAQDLSRYAEAGWSVWAVVPLARLGEAHTAFASSADMVQGWWAREDNALAFTQPEIP